MKKQRLFRLDGANTMPLGPVVAPGKNQPVVVPQQVEQLSTTLRPTNTSRDPFVFNTAPTNHGGLNGGGSSSAGGSGVAAGGASSNAPTKGQEVADKIGNLSMLWPMESEVLLMLAKSGLRTVGVDESLVMKMARKKDGRASFTLLCPHRSDPDRNLTYALDEVHRLFPSWYVSHAYDQGTYALRPKGEITSLHDTDVDVVVFYASTTDDLPLLRARLGALRTLGEKLLYLQQQGISLESTSNAAFASEGGYKVEASTSFSGYTYTMAYLIPYEPSPDAVPPSTPQEVEIMEEVNAADSVADIDPDFDPSDDEEDDEDGADEQDADTWTLLGFTLPRWLWLGAGGALLLLVVAVVVAVAGRKK